MDSTTDFWQLQILEGTALATKPLQIDAAEYLRRVGCRSEQQVERRPVADHDSEIRGVGLQQALRQSEPGPLLEHAENVDDGLLDRRRDFEIPQV